MLPCELPSVRGRFVAEVVQEGPEGRGHGWLSTSTDSSSGSGSSSSNRSNSSSSSSGGGGKHDNHQHHHHHHHHRHHRFLGKIVRSFHEEVQRRINVEAELKRRLGQVTRQAAARERKAARALEEAEVRRNDQVGRLLNAS